MSQVERQELSSAPEEGPRQELRSFPFYSEAEERFLKGQETLKRAGEDPELIGAAFLKFYGAADEITEKFLDIFKPIHSYYSATTLKGNLWPLRHRLDLINEIDYNILLLYIEDRNKFAHGGEFLLSRKEIEGYAKVVENIRSSLKEKSRELWEGLITCTDLGDLFASEIRKNIRKVLIDDLIELRNEWVSPFFDSEEDWWLWPPEKEWDWLPQFPKPNEKFSPSIPSTESDFVVTTQKEASVDNPAKIGLFARLLLGEDLSDIKPKTFKDFLDQDFPVVIFIPERHREGFLAKLDSIKERVSFVSYYYDKNAEFHLILEEGK